MDPLEQQLKRALEPKEPPAGFTRRVLARAQEQARQQVRTPAQAETWSLAAFLRPAWRTALAGALAGLMLLAAGMAYRRHQERLRGEKARAELMQALEIASSQLNQARALVLQDMRR